MFTFDVVPGTAVRDILEADRPKVIDVVRHAYLKHRAGQTLNPDSYFLRFPEKPDARIIALPAYLGDEVELAGIKWISSFPANVKSGMPRASAVLILNDYETGYPVACLEAAGISAARTAASAALAARALRPAGYAGTRIAVVGAGVIARNICAYLAVGGCAPESFLVHDLDETAGRALCDNIERVRGRPARFVPDLGEALEAETVVFATTALAPYVDREFKPGQVVLNISLRDLTPETVLAAVNIVDDVEHCLKANTSPHLAEQVSGSRDFIAGTLADVLRDEVDPQAGRAVIFSPFGLGVLDLAVGAHVLAQAVAAGTTHRIPGFFGETTRW